MFKKLGSLLHDWIVGRSTPAKSEKSAPIPRGGAGRASAVKDKKHTPKKIVAPEPHRGELESPEKRKRKRKKKPVVAGGASVPPLTELIGTPPMPEAFAEVPAEEGKTRFLDMGLPREVQFGIQDMGFKYLTPIQEQSLPVLLSGRDVCGKAQTGTGKTAAFLLAIFKHIMENPLPAHGAGYCRALVLAPTRELAIQIHKDAQMIGKYAGLNNLVIFGGMDHAKQRESLDRPIDILIGTPGRIIDFSRSSLKLNKAEILVIDEADRMLDMGFIPDVRRIVAQLPHREERQTMLYSATLDDTILRLAASFLHEPVMLESEPEEIVCSNIEQTFYTVSESEKLALVVWVLTHREYDRVIIFGNRKSYNLTLRNKLAQYGIKSVLLSGDIAQEKRLKVLESFRQGRDRVLIATDVAARGIHVDDVSLVINYDLPDRPEDYVHRIGRTGRAGKSGVSLSLLDEYGAYALPAIEEMLGEKFSSIFPEDEMVQLPPPDPNYREPAREKPMSRPRQRRDSNHRRR